MKRNTHNAARVVSVRRERESFEDEPPVTGPTEITQAADLIGHSMQPVIILRPSWLDLPAQRLISRITLLAICAIPGAIALTAAIHAAWRLS